VLAPLLNIPCLLVLPVLAVEWVLLLGLSPLVALARAGGARFVVTARGRRRDGVRVRYEARAPRWASLGSRAAAAAEIRADGEPHSLGKPQAILGSKDEDTEALRQKLRDGDEVRVDCQVQGFGVARSRDDWFTGQITASPAVLSFDHQRGFETISWLLPGAATTCGSRWPVRRSGPPSGTRSWRVTSRRLEAKGSRHSFWVAARR